MRFSDYETIEADGGAHLLRHREGGWYSVVLIDDGQLRDTEDHRRYANADSAGVDAIGGRLSEEEAWRRYYRVTQQWGAYIPPPDALVAWRESEGLTQERAAAVAGVQRLAWARWELGERGVPQWLADVLRQRWGSAP